MHRGAQRVDLSVAELWFSGFENSILRRRAANLSIIIAKFLILAQMKMRMVGQHHNISSNLVNIRPTVVTRCNRYKVFI